MSMTAALVMTSCSSDDLQGWPEPTTKTIPYTVTVSHGTRATVDEDLSTLRFAAGDKLSISGTNISGVLNMTSGVGETQATFSGNLTYNGAGDPADNLSLTATLVSAQQSGTELTYPTNAYCATVDEAVQKYSRLTGTGTYGAKSFALSQGTAFLNFKINFDYGADAGDQFSAVVSNNGTELSRANVTTETEDGKVVAKFVLPVASGTTFTNATVTMGATGSWAIIAATLRGKVYNVKKGWYAFPITANGDKVLFAPGNLQATYNGSSWTWAFAEHQWDYIGNAAGNTSVTDSSPFITGTGTVDLFGWVGASSTWNDVRKFGITSSASWNSTDGYGNVIGETMKAEWNSTNLNITNGGGYRWRTLTQDEWRYLGLSRPGATVNGTAGVRYTHCTINTDGTEVNGVIFFPDGAEYTYSEFTTLGNLNDDFGTGDYSTKCTSTQWAALASKGCAFLPAGGGRTRGTVVQLAGEYGGYWTSSASKSEVSQACGIGFHVTTTGSTSEIPWIPSEGTRSIGLSVRLFRPAE